MKKHIAFEMLLIFIMLSPFVYVGLNWQPDFVEKLESYIYIYLLAILFFYALPLFMQYLDSRKPNADFLLKSDKRIRLIWTSYLAALGFILFYYSIFELENDKTRLLGVTLSLFLFASGNFRQNLHPSSIFAGNGIFSKEVNLNSTDERNNRRIQRFTAKLFFWVGILGTIYFLYFNENVLTSWGLVFVGLLIFYGIALRLIKSVV